MDASGAVTAIASSIVSDVANVSQVVADVATKQSPDQIARDVAVAGVEIVHTSSLCCGLFTHSTTVKK